MTSDLQTLPWLTKLSVPAEIQDFWFRTGKKVGGFTGQNIFIFHISDEEYYNQGGPPPPLREDILARGIRGELKYFIDGQHYSEADMLKIIKLMAFL